MSVSRRPWWVPGDWPRAARSLLPVTLMWGIATVHAINRGPTWAVVVLSALAVGGVGGVVAVSAFYRRHPEQVGRGSPPLPLTRRHQLRLALGVGLGLACAVAGSVVLIAGNGPTGAVLFVLGLLSTLVCGTSLGEAARS